MPTVPTLNRQVQTQTTNIRQSNVSPGNAQIDTRGQQAFGQAAIGLAQTAMQIEEKERAKADELAVLKADQAMSQYETEFLYGRETGAMNQKGEDAFGLPDRLESDYDKKGNEILNSLANERQKAAFNRSLMSRRKDVNKQLYRHMSNEGQKFDDQLTESYIANEQNAALKNFHDPDRIDMSIQRTRAAIMQHGDRNGLPAEYTKMKLERAESQTYAGVISKILDGGDDMAAKAYYEKYKGRLTGEDQARVDKLLEAGTLAGESQRQSDALWMNAGEDLGSAMQKAERIKDPKLRDETMRRLRQKQSDKQFAIKAMEDRNFMAASEYVKGNPAADPKDTMPVSQWEALTLQQQQALRKYTNNPQNDDKKWLDFFDKSPQELAGMSRADFEQKYWVHFDSSHRTRAEKMWKDASDGIENPEVTNALTFKNRVDNTLRRAGIVDANATKSKFSKDEAARYAQFEARAAQALEDFERNELAGKRKATGQEVQKVLDGLLMDQVFVKKSFLGVDAFASDKEIPAALILEDEKGQITFPFDKIPQKEISAIQNLVRSKRGKPASKDQVSRAYAAYLANDRELYLKIIGE